MTKTAFRTTVLLAAAVLVLAFAWGWRQAVPTGLGLRSFEPFFFWSRDLGTFQSPGGTNAVAVVVNDAGAMHSGYHRTWVIASSAVWGRRVVAEGYLDFEDTRRESLPLRWLSEDHVEVRFREGRRSAGEVTRAYQVH